jgi:hypothetical protein
VLKSMMLRWEKVGEIVKVQEEEELRERYRYSSLNV